VGRSGNDARGRPSPVSWTFGLQNDPRKGAAFGHAYATGWVAPDIARLQVRFQDGTAGDVVLRDRYFLYDVLPAHWPAGHRPSGRAAFAGAGRVVHRQFLYPRAHCDYPGFDPACRNLAMGTG